MKRRIAHRILLIVETKKDEFGEALATRKPQAGCAVKLAESGEEEPLRAIRPKARKVVRMISVADTGDISYNYGGAIAMRLTEKRKRMKVMAGTAFAVRCHRSVCIDLLSRVVDNSDSGI